MFGIWVVDEWLTNNKRQILLFKTEEKAETVKGKLDVDPERPMEVKECLLPGEIYKGKLLNADVT